jgi:site-specific DNA recombinase
VYKEHTMQDNQPRAAIYVRVSTASQEDDGTSLGTQEEQCRQYASSRGYAVVSVFRDVFSGGVYRERPALTQLRALVRDRGVDIVIAYAVDRLSRNQAHLYILAEEIDDHGARLEFVTEDFENTSVGKFILSARAFAAEIEREKISERTQRGKHARAEAGQPIDGGILPFGYRWLDDKRSALAPDPETSPWVQRMFAWVVEGWTLRRIAGHMNDMGVPTPRKKESLWGHATIWGYSRIRPTSGAGKPSGMSK